jgi:hypothetical protein
MSGLVSEMWTQFSPDEQDQAWHAMRNLFGDRGGNFIMAIAKEARLYTSGSIALERAQAALNQGTYPALQPAEPATPTECEDCGERLPLEPRWDWATSTVIWLCATHWPAHVPTTPTPAQEEP